MPDKPFLIKSKISSILLGKDRLSTFHTQPTRTLKVAVSQPPLAHCGRRRPATPYAPFADDYRKRSFEMHPCTPTTLTLDLGTHRSMKRSPSLLRRMPPSPRLPSVMRHPAP